jgi:hypothetical protein
MGQKQLGWHAKSQGYSLINSLALCGVNFLWMNVMSLARYVIRFSGEHILICFLRIKFISKEVAGGFRDTLYSVFRYY